LYVSRDVTFNEDKSYFENTQEENNNSIVNYQENFILPVTNILEEVEAPRNNNEENKQIVELYGNNNNNDNNNNDNDEHDNDNNNGHEEGIGLRRSSRPTQPSTRLRNFVTNKITYPIQNFISYDNISTNYQVFLSSLSKVEEPNFFQEAITQPIWCKAMKEELKALEKNETWTIVPLPNNKKPVGCK
jgi:hypothetical protein